MADPRFPGGYVDRSPFAPAGTDVARACAADPRVADLPLCAPILARIVPEITGCFQGRMRKGRRSVDPRPFIPLTGYALGLSRRPTWITVSEEELGGLTFVFAVAQLRST